jgi:hypothetical protein
VDRSIARLLLVSSLVASAVLAVASCHAFSDLAAPAGNDGAAEPLLDGPTTDGATDAGPDLPGLVTMTEALQICAKVLACPHVGPSLVASFSLPVDATNFSACVHALSGPINPRRQNKLTSEGLRCVAKADACNVAACVPFEEIDRTDPRTDPGCADGGVVGSCAGATKISCFGGNVGSWATNCTNPSFATGSQCASADGRARCDVTVTGCPIGPQCVDGTEPLSVADFCFDAGGVAGHTKFDCRASGQSCQGGVPGCAVTPCAVHLRTQCEDEAKLSVCFFDELTILDCAPAGPKSRCVTHGVAAYCSGPHDECTPYDPLPDGGKGINSCDGTAIRLCVGGRPVSADCREAGVGFVCRTGNAPKSNFCGPPS